MLFTTMTNSHNHQASQHAIESFTPQPQSPADHDDASTKDSLTTANDGFVSQQPAIIAGEKYHQSRGVTRMENVAYLAKHGGRVGRTTYYLIGVSVLVCMFVVSDNSVPAKHELTSSLRWKAAPFQTTSNSRHRHSASTPKALLRSVSRPISYLLSRSHSWPSSAT